MRRGAGTTSPQNTVGSPFGNVVSRSGSTNNSAAGLDSGAAGQGIDPEIGSYGNTDIDSLKKVIMLSE